MIDHTRGSMAFSWEPVNEKTHPGFMWDQRFDIGRRLCDPGVNVYTEAYYENLRKREESEVGRAIVARRVMLTLALPFEGILEIGPGCGAYRRAIEAENEAVRNHAGPDIRYSSVDRDGSWPKIVGDKGHKTCIVAWDSIEHLDNLYDLSGFGGILLTVPCEDSCRDWMTSHHYKPNEHIWYFTPHGLIRVLWSLGYRASWMTRSEEMFGRKSVVTALFLNGLLAAKMYPYAKEMP